MEKIARIIDKLGERELRDLKDDLDSGFIAKLINNRLENVSQDWNKVCPVCHSPVDAGSLTFIFGPSDFRKKASFCALDCMEYFIGKLRGREGEGNE